ncbi:MAG TPA: carbamoyltransferase C-terminal domain-containing protein [Chitinophagaceae bacterium]|jgi:carbamoyltransferase|nr:carbamoyltransferase C-terminal domain-containing protein [Chitinophagaceae bacterium]
MPDPTYVLGIGLSHDGAACLLKDGQIHVAIEKERISRIKHDGGNDSLAVHYCLDAAGIGIDDLSLVVQSANFEKNGIQKHRYKGPRLFPASTAVPFVTISHHLAHAWSAAGTSPFDECNVMVIDGCGSFYQQCDDLGNAFVPADVNSIPGLYGEKDSFYFFDGKNMKPLFKDFSIINYTHKPGQVYLPTSNHSIGGLYSMAAHYCFGDFDAAGKLMGLAPYGNRQQYKEELFLLKEGRVLVNDEVMHRFFTEPADPVTHPFADHFQYYADIAAWVQAETERAVLYIIQHRLALHPHEQLVYAGGVALNAVTNAKIIDQTNRELYIEPAAGDNGLAIGCAYYGWIEVLKKEKVKHSGSTCFGKIYDAGVIKETIGKTGSREDRRAERSPDAVKTAAALLAAGKTIGFFQLGCEFGPRALGRRSILADPRTPGIREHINRHIKLREDFRPFAPAVLYEDKDIYFKKGYESPYMILIDEIKEEWKDKMPGIVHVDGTCRVQTVKDKAEPFYQLLTEFKEITGISVLLNTSFNRMSQPIVETPEEAILFFYESRLDALVINDFIFTKQ